MEKFIVKIKRDRLLFELSGKKRMDGIGRFAHGADEMLLKEKIIESGNHLDYYEVVKTIEKYKISDQWYIMTYIQSIDKISCSLSKALDFVLGNGMPAIIVSDTMAVVETEQCTGAPMRYILHD